MTALRPPLKEVTALAAPKVNLITIIVIKLYNNMTTPASLSILAYELINDRYSRAKYLGIECIMETKTGLPTVEAIKLHLYRCSLIYLFLI